MLRDVYFSVLLLAAAGAALPASAGAALLAAAGAALPASAGAARGGSGAGELAASPEEIRPLLIGSEIPDVAVTPLEGEPVSLREIVDGRPTLLIFYRGGW